VSGSRSYQTHFFYNLIHICKIFSQICVKFLSNMCKISHKFVKNEPCQMFMNICVPNLAYFTSILQKFKMIVKKLSYQTILIKSYRNVKCPSFKYL
jgi:hypothetical protein